MNDRSAAEENAPSSGAQAEYKAILANASIGIAFTRDRKFTLCSPKFAEMFGWTAEELIGQPGDVLHPSGESYEAMGAIAVPVLSAGRQLDIEWQMRRRDGSIFLARLIAEAVSPNDAQKGTVWFVEDITVRKRHADDVARLLLEQDAILNTAPIGICFVKDRHVVRCTRRFEQMHGYAPGELDGQPTSLLYADEAAYQAIGEPFGAEVSARRKDGSTCWSRISGRAVDRSEPALGSVWMAEDITLERAARQSLEASRDALERAVAERTAELRAANERLQAEITDRRQAETRAQHLADHDALTGLPNRRLLEDRLTQALALSQRNRKQTAVMFVDLDHFKTINDTLGHAAGDLVLKEVSERLVNQLRVVDTICRMGGDEFVVVLPEIKRSSDAANVAVKILETVAQPFVVDERELSITPSVGISVFPDDGRDAGTLIRNADAAMYHAKETGRANYQFFTEQMNQSASRRLALENDLRQAVLKHEMRVYYQPVVDAASGRTAAHEALLRWQHPTRGVIQPAEFIHLAEDTGLVLQLDEWILGEACRWAGPANAILVSVNLSARQFNDPKLTELVARVLKSTGLAPQHLELDIAESVAMQQPDFALAVLKKLKDLGVRIALDDFGIGLSGVAHLSRVPVDRIKIDRSLIAGAPRDTDRHPVVPAIVGLGHALGLKVVAKGIETEAQKAVLIACGCDYLQGFIIGKPVDAETASKEYA